MKAWAVDWHPQHLLGWLLSASDPDSWLTREALGHVRHHVRSGLSGLLNKLEKPNVSLAPTSHIQLSLDLLGIAMHPDLHRDSWVLDGNGIVFNTTVDGLKGLL